LETDYLKEALPDEAGPAMDLLMARHMGQRAIESGGMPWLLDGNKAYAVPPYSTDHNAFFGRVVEHLRDRKIRVQISDEGDRYRIAFSQPRHGALAEERGASLPFAGCLAAISALRMEAERSTKKIGPGE